MADVLAIPGAGTSGGDVTLTLPSTGISAGNLGIIVLTFSQSSGGTNTITTPTGWTLLETQTFSTSMQTLVYTRTMAATDNGATVALPQVSTTGKYTACGVVVRGVVATTLTRTITTVSASATTHTNPTATGSAPRVTVSLFGTRGSASVTTITPPAGMTNVSTAFTTGGGMTANAIAVNMTEDADGTVGGGTWTMNAAQGASLVTFALSPEVVVPPTFNTKIRLYQSVLAGTPLTPSLFTYNLPAHVYGAHRGGDPGPEETQVAYRATYAASPRYAAEADMQILSTGEVVLCHDDTIDRTVGTTSAIASGTVSNFTLTQWRTIRMKRNTGYTGTDAPAGELKHLIDDHGPGPQRLGDRLLLLEVKVGTNVNVCIEAIKNGGIAWCTIVQAFTLSDAQAARAAGLEAMYLSPTPNYATLVASGIKHIGMDYTLATQAVCNEAHANGISVWVYTVNSTTNRDTALANGVDHFFSNKPATIDLALNSKPTVVSSSIDKDANWSVMLGGVETPIKTWSVIKNGVEVPLTN